MVPLTHKQILIQSSSEYNKSNLSNVMCSCHKQFTSAVLYCIHSSLCFMQENMGSPRTYQRAIDPMPFSNESNCTFGFHPHGYHLWFSIDGTLSPLLLFFFLSSGLSGKINPTGILYFSVAVIFKQANNRGTQGETIIAQ